jgi:hypothetical protein
MGNGPKGERETAKAPAGDGPGTGGGGAPTDFCLRTHTVGMQISGGARPEIGITVWVVLGSPPKVLGEGGELGVLDDPLAGGLTQCLVEGFRFSGAVDRVDLEGRRAIVTVTGEEGS